MSDIQDAIEFLTTGKFSHRGHTMQYEARVDLPDDTKDMRDLAIKALRQMRAEPCLYCGNSTVKINAHRHYQDLVMREDIPVNFCPSCGRRLPEREVAK